MKAYDLAEPLSFLGRFVLSGRLCPTGQGIAGGIQTGSTGAAMTNGDQAVPSKRIYNL